MTRQRGIQGFFFLCVGLIAACTDQTVFVNVTVTVAGPGSVVSDPPGISCGSTCTAAFPAGTVVSLKAQPQAGAKMQFFSGTDCSAGSPPCWLTLFRDSVASAQFVPLDPSCTDGMKNATETDVDCGGSCAPCDIDKSCQQGTDCANGQCLVGLCSACRLDTNLLFDGDAELTLPSGMVPGWTFSSGFEVEPYGGGNLASTDPGPPQRGTQFFSGGLAAKSSATTMVDLSMCTTLIAQNKVTLRVGGWLGGQLFDNDNMVVQFGILQGAYVTTQVTLGPVLAPDRVNVTGLFQRQGSAVLPAGTCGLQVTMTATRAAGFSNDAYADNLTALVSLQ